MFRRNFASRAIDLVTRRKGELHVMETKGDYATPGI